MSLSFYDCTIRDGKPLNGFDNGAEIISNIEKGLTDAGIEYIDVGYLSDETLTSDFALYSNIDQAENLLPRDTKTEWVISIRLGRNEMNLIPECHGQIKIIRFAVPFKGTDELNIYAEAIKDKGYNVICEIDNTFGYSDIDLLKMVEVVNEAGVSQMTIADKLGRIDENDLQRVYYLLNNNLNPKIRIGARFSDAAKSAYQTAQNLINLNERDKRDIVIEGSLFGMGEHQGNLVLEVIADYVNDFFDGNYRLDALYKLIGKYIQPIVGNQTWGYHPAYYFAGKSRVDSKYAQYMLDRDVPLEKINAALIEIAKTEENKDYDEKIAEMLLSEMRE